jgi:hypothetical protein
MQICKWLWGGAPSTDDMGVGTTNWDDGGSCINPATGLPMISGDLGGVDVGGSPYGTDLHVHMSAMSSHGIGTEVGGVGMNWPNDQ